MKQKLIHILDNSACLTWRQLKEYIGSTMTSEECHAVEHHINSCTFCNDALDGAMTFTPETLAVAANFNGNFLKAHFSLSDPQVHLNSMVPSIKRKPGVVKPFLIGTSLAALLITGLAVVLLLQAGKNVSVLNLKHLHVHKSTAKITVAAIKATQAMALK